MAGLWSLVSSHHCRPEPPILTMAQSPLVDDE
jgi:hypothetical protein